MKKTTKLLGSVVVATGLMVSGSVHAGCSDYADFFKELFGCAVRELPIMLQLAGVDGAKIVIATRIAQALLDLLNELMQNHPEAFNELVNRCHDEASKATRSVDNQFDELFQSYGFLNDDGSVNNRTKKMVLQAIKIKPDNQLRRVTRSIGFNSDKPSYTIDSLGMLLKNGSLKPVE